MIKPPPHSTIFIDSFCTVDFAVFSPIQGIYGESFEVSLEASGPLDRAGFVFDFSKLKTLAKRHIDETLDHTLVLNQMDLEERFDDHEDGSIMVVMKSVKDVGSWKYKAPAASFCFLPSAGEVTAVQLETFLNSSFQTFMDKISEQSELSVKFKLKPEHGESYDTFFRYTHGLTYHDGNCQRLFHGHRSKLRARVGGVDRLDVAQWITKEWFGESVHFASRSQVQAQVSLLAGERMRSSSFAVPLRYRSSFGVFEATIPSAKIIMINDETSIENLCRYVRDHAIKEFSLPQNNFELTIFEGIRKGSRF